LEYSTSNTDPFGVGGSPGFPGGFQKNIPFLIKTFKLRSLFYEEILYDYAMLFRF
jgi:hypothetical protein